MRVLKQILTSMAGGEPFSYTQQSAVTGKLSECFCQRKLYLETSANLRIRKTNLKKLYISPYTETARMWSACLLRQVLISTILCIPLKLLSTSQGTAVWTK